jgi:hypothetical protein
MAYGFRKAKHVFIAKVDCVLEYDMCKAFNVSSYPTVYFAPRGRFRAVYAHSTSHTPPASNANHPQKLPPHPPLETMPFRTVPKMTDYLNSKTGAQIEPLGEEGWTKLLAEQHLAWRQEWDSMHGGGVDTPVTRRTAESDHVDLWDVKLGEYYFRTCYTCLALEKFCCHFFSHTIHITKHIAILFTPALPSLSLTHNLFYQEPQWPCTGYSGSGVS